MGSSAKSESPHVLLCACGGIACYKAVEVLRALQKAGCVVRVAATEGSLHFVGAATWEGLTHEEVATSVFESASSKIPHIDLATWADAILVVPATANVISKMRLGIADDLVSATLLATDGQTPVVVAPAMNTNMWRNPATQENVEVLRSRGVEVVVPATGRLACDAVGEGKLADVAEIAARVFAALEERAQAEGQSSSLAGVSIVVTAGPTHEAIDPVRYIANASSGKMGYAIAREAARRGASVTLVSGPVNQETPAGVSRIDVVSAQEMYERTTEAFIDADVAICAAAVADYTPANPADHKLKKAHEHLDVIELRETKDILAELSRTKDDGGRHRIVCGFAAETNDLVENAQAKLERKGCDLIVANDVSRPDSGFGSDTNHVTLISSEYVVELPTLTKEQVASRLLDTIASLVAGA